MIEPFPRRYREALADGALRVRLLAFQRRWRGVRDAQMRDRDFERNRRRLADIKNDVLDHLPLYLERFTAAAETSGATVVRAADADEAVSYVTELARTRGVQVVAKSKSMAGEEIDLSHRLEGSGLRVVETDLGEWIVQLAGERPSHIIAPAIHKDRRQIADLFMRVTGRPVSREDIGEQVRFAREMLREEFLRSQMGISGANAIVAETGSVMLVTNEGNAELVTSIPPLHVVLVGIEKLLPTLDDALLDYELLVHSATGQPVTTYLTWLDGPSHPDGELHIVLIDNGRSAMLASPLFREALRCIRCGACSNICPSYGVVGGHVFGYIYSGAIGLVNTPFHNGLENDVGPQSLCVSCNACQTVCPVDIPLPRQILDVRAWAAREGHAPLPVRVGMEIWSRPRLADLSVRAGAVLQRPFKHGEFLEPPVETKWTSWRRPPALADRPFRDSWRSIRGKPLPGELGKTLTGVTVGYFIQCITDRLFVGLARSVVDVLHSLGARVILPAGQHCCGLPALDTGLTESAKRMAKGTIRVLERCDADYIVTGGTSCAIAVIHDYPHLFRDEPEWQIRASRQAARLMDITSFLHAVARLPEGSLALTGKHQLATYHYFCQAYNVLGMRDEPVQLLERVCGIPVVPLPEANVCCGFGGSVSVTRPEMCRHILARKLDNVFSTDATLLVTDNPGCIMHIRGGIAAEGRDLRVAQTVEIVAEAITAMRTGARD